MMVEGNTRYYNLFPVGEWNNDLTLLLNSSDSWGRRRRAIFAFLRTGKDYSNLLQDFCSLFYQYACLLYLLTSFILQEWLYGISYIDIKTICAEIKTICGLTWGTFRSQCKITWKVLMVNLLNTMQPKWSYFTITSSCNADKINLRWNKTSSTN